MGEYLLVHARKQTRSVVSRQEQMLLVTLKINMKEIVGSCKDK